MEFFYYDNHKISFDKFLSKHEKVLLIEQIEETKGLNLQKKDVKKGNKVAY